MAQEPNAVDQMLVAPGLAARQLTLGELVTLRLWRRKLALVGVAILGLMAVLALGAPVITPENPYDLSTWNVVNQGLSPRLTPAWYFILGTDGNGHLILSQIAWGARASLSVTLMGTLAALLIGVPIGALAGYFGGWLDTLLMRVTDVFLILPFVPLVLLAAGIFGGRDALSISRVLIVFSWPVMARLTRAACLALRDHDLTTAARALGVRDSAIIWRHLLPNALSTIVVTTTVTAATCITVETIVDFFGLGLQYPDISWGTVLLAAFTSLNWSQWWTIVFPGAALAVTILAMSFVGSGLDDALDARSAGV